MLHFFKFDFEFLCENDENHQNDGIYNEKNHNERDANDSKHEMIENTQ